MANEISTAGIELRYKDATTPGTKPATTTKWTAIPNVKAIPEFNPEPATLECTDLADTVWKRYIPGLKDPGGAIGITANFTSAFKTAWETVVTLAGTKEIWWEVAIPGMDSFYFSGEPSALGFNGAEVDSVLEEVAYITPNSVSGFASASGN